MTKLVLIEDQIKVSGFLTLMNIHNEDHLVLCQMLFIFHKLHLGSLDPVLLAKMKKDTLLSGSLFKDVKLDKLNFKREQKIKH